MFSVILLPQRINKVIDDTFDLQWIVRENGELDEKLPIMARDVRRREIDYNQLDEDEDEEPNPDVIDALLEVLGDHLYSFEEMTQEEVTNAVQQLWLASVLAECVEDGILDEVDGKYSVHQ